MRSAFEFDLVRSVSRIALVALIGSVAAACSTDTVRLSSNPFSDAFKTADAGGGDPTLTGSIEPRSVAPITRSTVRSEPLPPVAAAAPAMPAAPVATAARTASGGSGWSATGGTSVTLGSGDSLQSISNRYGVPPAAILSANDLTAGQVTPGRRLVIPVYSASADRAPAPVAAAPAPAGRVVASTPITTKKAPPATVAEAATRRRPGQAPVVAAAPAKPLPGKLAPVRQAEVKPAPAVKAPAVKSAAKPVPAPAAKVAAAPVAKPIAAAPAKVAKVEPAPKPAVVATAEPPKPAPAPVPAKEPESTASLPSATPASENGPGFRWPARGRVISAFGGGNSNEGINIAVPEGSAVKAAGDGVVAYAGSEVKGYGNLVLIRHDNGYVSAYANNGDLDVKRGQKVTRGQTIAKSGQTGNVTSPQLHFEIRKGSTPVDPMKYLASAN